MKKQIFLQLQNGKVKVVSGRLGGEHKDYHGWGAQERYEARQRRKAQERARLQESLLEAEDFQADPWPTKPVERMKKADGKSQIFWHLNDVLGNAKDVTTTPSNVIEFDTKRRGRRGKLHIAVKTDGSGHLTYASVG